jgi:hypothetical protein
VAEDGARVVRTLDSLTEALKPAGVRG